ncbi:hypothetical protein [Streptacidiphilus sp. PAMC 29251]
MPETPAFPADLIALQRAMFAAQDRRASVAADPDADPGALGEATRAEAAAAVALNAHPGKIAAQAGGHWEDLWHAARQQDESAPPVD